MKLLIDECLSDELTKMALDREHWGTTSVKRRGLAGVKDWNLMPIILAEHFVLVTKNAFDFRGPAEDPGSKGLYAKEALHPGLVCLNGPVGMDLDMQKELFDAALDDIERESDLVNMLLEVTLRSDAATELTIRRYDLPKREA